MPTIDDLDLDPVPQITVPSAGVWHVPGARNPYFTGRDTLLGELDQRFKTTADSPIVQAIVGLGGVGKTQAAAEYAWRHQKDYQIIWWLPADDATTLSLSYAQLAKQLGLQVPESADLETIRHRLRRALGAIGGWLLIFDNAPSWEAVQNFLPLGNLGRVLITSRDAEWNGVAGINLLRMMERSESVDFLLRRVGRGGGSAKSAEQLAQALQDHPLAMEQASAHIVESRINFATYLKLFESHWAELLADGTGLATPGGEYPDSLAMSLELSFRQLEESLAPAQSLLNLFAFFSGESIPPWLLDTAESISDSMPLTLMPLMMDRLTRDEALVTLHRYSLLDGDLNDLHVHRLVSALARRRLSTIEKADLANASLKIVTAAFHFDSQDPSTWPACAEVLPHALAVAAHAESLGVEQEAAAKVMNVAGRFMMRQNRLNEARETLTQALNLAKKVHGPLHARLAGMTNDLGRVLQKQGDAVAAREYFEKSMRIDSNIYGEDNAHSVSVVNNYAMTLHFDGDFTAAREHLERALKTCEKEHGPAHLRVATVRNNLACVLRDSGDLANAREQFDQALDSAIQSCGEMHPVIAQITFNLATLLRASGDARAAGRILEIALRVDRHNYGPVHPNIARDLNELAAVSQSLGDEAASHRFADEARSMTVTSVPA